MLVKLDFSPRWVLKIMKLVTSITYHICHSGKQYGPILPNRGLRQGDPLSLYLFLIVAEGLSALLSSFERRGQIQGVKVTSLAPSIPHLFFVDDALYFFKATVAQAFIVKHCLRLYEKASGQQVNFQKFEMFFSKNCSEEQTNIAKLLNVQSVNTPGRYLGLPSVVGKRKKDALGYVEDKVWKKLQSWKRVCCPALVRKSYLKLLCKPYLTI